MNENFSDYNYSKQYIFVEDDNKKILKRLNRDEVIDTDDFQYKIVTSVSQTDVEGKKMHLLQYEDKQLGWIELEKSIQIFRFPAEHYQIIEDIFQPNELNEKMGISKDFIAHFQGKLLNIKSQITYDGELYYSVFLKNKFHGFHKASYLDPLLEANENIEPENIQEDLSLFKFSNLTNEETEVIDIESLKVTSVFKHNRIAKVQVNGALNYWVSMNQLPEFNLPLSKPKHQQSDLYFEDLIYSINKEREKTKEILKSVLSAREFVSSKKGGSTKSDISSQLKIEELNEELTRYKKDNEDLAKRIDKLFKENKLANQRLEHQLDYKKRLEAQRDKYRDRMNIVEEKLKNLDARYKDMKMKHTKKK